MFFGQVKVEIRKQISSSEEDDIESIIAHAETNGDGEFSVGPLNSSFKYDISMSKEGFKIIKNTGSANQLQFNAYKLAELVVEVIDNVTGKSLPGRCRYLSVELMRDMFHRHSPVYYWG